MSRRTQIAALVTLALAPALWGCGSSDDAATGSPSGKGAESELPTLGKADSWAYANDHGTFPFGKQAWAEIDGLNRLHAWTFNVGDAGATVAAHTEDYADAFGPVDTVMYFYRRRADGGWGNNIVRNDDCEDGSTDWLWSCISKKLTAGEYRILVKGYSSSDTGKFGIRATCEGSGCMVNPSTSPKCEALSTHAVDTCFPANGDEPVDWSTCLRQTPNGDQYDFAISCCKDYPTGHYPWCPELAP
ncbi:MAG: hypothetical protein R3B13_40270 [Polyangiaceae bacterium]